MKDYKFGLDTFGDITLKDDGTLDSVSQTIRNTVQHGILADEVGIDAIGIGEHHRSDYSVTSPDVLLTAIAAQTKNIHVGSAVTVLSSDDPVRVFQRFATLNAISEGRAEVTLGRGSFIESFPLFGYDLNDYDILFSEKVDLFMKLVNSNGEVVNWEGTHRKPLVNQPIHPQVEPFQTWIGVGGTPASIIRAANYDVALAIAIIGGLPHKFIPHTDLYRKRMEELGHARKPIAIHSPGHIADTDEQAQEEAYKAYKETYEKLGEERGWNNTVTPMQYQAEIKGGSLYIGSPETVAKRIAETLHVLDADRFDFKYATGFMKNSKLMKSIELYGTKVVPMVKDILNS